LGQHKGEWVAVHLNRLVAVGQSALEVREAAAKKGVTDPTIFRVPKHPERLAFY
jgi:hypothetical protein